MTTVPLVLLLISAATASTQATPPRPGDLSLTLATDRTDYVQHEAVELTITLRNTADHPIRAALSPDPQTGRLEVHWKRPGGEFAHLEYLSGGVLPGEVRMIRCGVVLPRTWARAEQAVHPIVVGFDERRKEFVLEEVGEHQFRLVYHLEAAHEGPPLQSNVAAINVAAPTDGERAGFAAYSADVALVAQYRPFSPIGTTHVLQADEYLERFPLSPYSRRLLEGLRRYVAVPRTPEETALHRKLGVPLQPR